MKPVAIVSLFVVPVFTIFTPNSGNAAPCFFDAGVGMIGADASAAAWGDFDNDGDLDLLVAGMSQDAYGEANSRIYRNDGGPDPTFTEFGVGLPGVIQGAAAWGDYDNDGDLDILISGYNCNGPVTRIFRSSGGPHPIFHDTFADLPRLSSCSVAWGDYDNDGDLDIALAGETGLLRQSAVLRSNGGPNPTFIDIGADLPGLSRGTVAWADFDKDGHLDLLLTGYDSFPGQALVYRNSGGALPTFILWESLGSGGDNSEAAWGDYDNDGDLDILFAAGAEIHSQQTTHHFFSITPPLVGVAGGAAAWGDYNNDGLLDALLVGLDGNDPKSAIYTAPTWADLELGLAPVGGGSGTVTPSAAAWGDYDNDGDLDVALVGRTTYELISRVYRNDCGTTNTPPAAPTGLSANVVGNQATFSWSPATDAETPSAGLSYNIRVGTTSGGSEILSPMAHPTTGIRRIPALGNTGQRTSWTLTVPGPGPFYWSVQAIDGSYAGSLFANEQFTGVTAVDETQSAVSPLLRLAGPNPFSKTIAIEFGPLEGERASIAIYDLAGRVVRTLHDGVLPAGSVTRTWDGTDASGGDVPSGLYVVRMRAGTIERSEKLVMIR